ncbi:hypothetical protein HOP50_02g15630 [Chloropicon primus]|uniref:Biogenesis of lysosome-related organelles complex 1 subunit 7 n=1 Tax=Chloropicon primus TaxID=1764295 RepID=A0A5B8MFS8_9CHLO|nr:hypothetical protein A3770_02p15720 [Chloropicon primus]UPQ98263.1 hypothetical protein HOP50_02g15630 [Chloropicon primus]|mmetsp:Transcript_9372/g.26663  ORF Transcript_9372/g.26663 Transcript_9372/m.26663 type:complete len:116 (-) Transcript_9372:210-557(-)|eukprot:QDZ19054.1 hypothetical protein A3770_02p15720 [Chloropicon primus]
MATPTTTTGLTSHDEVLAEEFLNVIDGSVQDCHEEVSLVLESQQELQKSLHRLGGEVQKVFQRLPRTEITKRTSKIPVLRRRCQRLGSKVKEIQDRLARISVIAEGLPAQQAGTS